MTKNEFITTIAGYVQKYAADYGIKVHSPIIAQAILESNWGESTLSATYHNYFGLKCGSSWKGKSVNLSTKEEFSPGTLTAIRDNFRVYDSMEEGVKGYFEFIQLARYQNLKGITDPQTYLETIKADGYATSSSYVQNNMKLISQYDLTQYDKEEESMSVIIGSAKWGESGGYNQTPGDASGNEVATESFYVHKLGWVILRANNAEDREKIAQAMQNACNNNLIGYDMGDRLSLYNHLKAKGSWNPADVTSRVETDCSALARVCCLHAGIVVGNFTTANEASMLLATGRFTKIAYTNQGALLRGDILVTKTSGHTAVVLSGSTGAVASTATAATAASNPISKTWKWKGRVVNCEQLYVRSWAGKENAPIKKHPLLNAGDTVQVCDSRQDTAGTWWYYVYIEVSKCYGFVHPGFIQKI